MTRTMNARIAGATFLLYIALGISALAPRCSSRWAARPSAGSSSAPARSPRRSRGWASLASVVLVFGLPLRIVGLVDGWLAWLMWLPMLLFEVPLGLWLLVRGVGTAPILVAHPIGMRPSRAS